jgi:hypothetical protein
MYLYLQEQKNFIFYYIEIELIIILNCFKKPNDSKNPNHSKNINNYS